MQLGKMQLGKMQLGKMQLGKMQLGKMQLGKMQLEYSVRGAELSDLHKIMVLYKAVAARSGGIARQVDEVTEAYIRNFIERCHKTGIIPTITGELEADIPMAWIHQERDNHLKENKRN